MLYLFVFLGLDGAITKLNRRQNRRYRDARKWVSTSFPRSLQYFRIDTTAFSNGLFLPSFPFAFLSYLDRERCCQCSKRQSRAREREKGNKEESARTRRPVSIDSLERRLESADREIEIRIEFARARIEIGPGSALPKAKNRQKVLWQPRSLSKSRYSNRLDAKYSSFPPYHWRRGVCSREFRIGHLSKVPLPSLRLVSIESTSEKVLGGNIWKYSRRSQALSKNRMHRYSPRTWVTSFVVKIESLSRDGWSLQQESF